MDNNNTFKSPTAISLAFHLAFLKGRVTPTPGERAKRAIDIFLADVRKDAEVPSVYA